MRFTFPLAVLLIAQAGAAWAVAESNMARPGATYSTLEAHDPAACERACAEDTICMAWSYRESACELKATVPGAVIQSGASSGVSARARISIRVRVPAPATATIPETPPPTAADAGDDDLSLALLGGPEPDRGLRHRLGN